MYPPKAFGPRSLAIGLASALFIAHAAGATVYALSTTADKTVDGTKYKKGDVVAFDAATSELSFALPPGTVAGKANLDAAHRLANGHWLVSTSGNATVGGQAVAAVDLVELDADGVYLRHVMSAADFGNRADIDAAFATDEGQIVLSTSGRGKLAGLVFEKDDLVRYDPVAGSATIVLNHSLFALRSNIVGVHVLADASILLATSGAAELGGLAFGQGDWVRYDPVSDSATLEGRSADAFGSRVGIDALSVFPPRFEPVDVPALSTGGRALLALALLSSVVSLRGRRASGSVRGGVLA